MNLYGHKINQLARCFTKKLNEKIAPLDLYASQWGIIIYLHKVGECTQVELCHYLSVEAPTVTRTLKRMEEGGWILRIEGNDKREKRIRLTSRGLEMFPECYEIASSLETDIVKDFTKEELDIFNRVLEKMMKNME